MPHRGGQDIKEASRRETRTSLPALDADRYLPMIADMEISDEQRLELLAIVWDIMCAFVELGFGANSFQNLLPAIIEKASKRASDTVELEGSKTTKRETSGGNDDEE